MRKLAGSTLGFFVLLALLVNPFPASAQGITVSSASPNTAVQGTINLDVTINGNGYKHGAKAKWFVSGTTNPGGVSVNNTTFVSGNQLIANITVAIDAVVAGYDIQVQNADGRTGVGQEAFAIQSNGQGACSAQDISLKVTALAGLTGDSKGAVYQDGVDGVFNTVVHFCSGSYDATVGLNKSKRSMGFTFPPAIPGSNIVGPSPVWANGGTFQAQPFFNVHDILWGRKNGKATFTTRMAFTSLAGPGDPAGYHLVFMADPTDAFVGPPPYQNADVNSPNETSTVTVQDFPGTCRTTPGGTLDYWIVTAQNWNIPPGSGYMQVGTLYKNAKSNTLVHSGQYTVPFQLRLDALTCLPW